MWDKRVVEKVDVCVRDFTLAVFFRNVADHFEWGFARVYGLNFSIDRRGLWDELAGILSWWNMMQSNNKKEQKKRYGLLRESLDLQNNQ
jgi:hypothetical protein